VSILSTFIEVRLPTPENFLKVMETLTRIGTQVGQDKRLVQTCHIFHRQGRYWITHYKEMMSLDGREAALNEEDVTRRNTIALLLAQWSLVELVSPEITGGSPSMAGIKIIPYKEKADWQLEARHDIGRRRRDIENH
jgi:hypothetical protein